MWEMAGEAPETGSGRQENAGGIQLGERSGVCGITRFNWERERSLLSPTQASTPQRGLAGQHQRSPQRDPIRR